MINDTVYETGMVHRPTKKQTAGNLKCFKLLLLSQLFYLTYIGKSENRQSKTDRGKDVKGNGALANHR